VKRVIASGVLALVLLLGAGCGGSHRCSGNELTLRAVPTHGQPITPQGMQTAQQIMQNRLDRLGVSSPTVDIKGGDEIVIKFLGAHVPPAEVAKIATITGRLEIFDFEPSLAPPTVRGNQEAAPLASLYALLEAVQNEANTGPPQSYYLFKTTAPHQVLQGPVATRRQLLLPYKGGKQPPHTQVLKVPAGREPVVCRGASNCIGAGSNGTSKTGQYWYLLMEPAALTGKDLVESDITATTDPSSGAPIVLLSFTGRGGKAFQAITKAEYDRGLANAGQAAQLNARSQNVINEYAGHNAIVLDGGLQSTPYIDYTDPTLSLGIPPGNGAEILTGSAAEADRLAFVLRSGSLPYTFEKVSQTSCSR
jgi:preprotein translocase subunit SecD